ncbi:hypothetical protein [Bradyrhizobium sp. NP1]|uniref:hypothetical protein n=1 Tax=Bradyrhizobium sp. NP1 TaxID=3049772 RepID=UPI0025A54335|nr:hypothetical protein [Bradyrhizobium sp. NP1]WJR77085.1 hypothetical protein QOU61_30765 [Bradyrhizobium sp. NP1]
MELRHEQESRNCAEVERNRFRGAMDWLDAVVERSLDRANVAILSVCGIAVGYLWHRLMRWQFRRTRMLPPAGPDSGR